MHIVLFCFAFVMLYYISYPIDLIRLPISFRVTSLVLVLFGMISTIPGRICTTLAFTKPQKNENHEHDPRCVLYEFHITYSEYILTIIVFNTGTDYVIHCYTYIT